jgi:hypothetical protein
MSYARHGEAREQTQNSGFVKTAGTERVMLTRRMQGSRQESTDS